MGKFDFEVDPEFLRSLGRLADVDRIAPQMIDEAMPILEANVKKELAKHRRTGMMLSSVRKTKAGKSKRGGYYAAVRPTGTSKIYMTESGKIKTRKEPVRNMEILAHLEYGLKKKSGAGWRQEPVPILTKAIEDSRNAVYDKMQEVFNREVSE